MLFEARDLIELALYKHADLPLSLPDDPVSKKREWTW